MASYREIMDYFTSKGYAPHHAAGIAGNIAQESSLNPDAVNPKSGAYGYAQWLGSRKTRLENYAHEQGGDISDPQTQLAFINHELNTTERPALESLLKTRNAGEAASVFSDQYERAGANEKNNPKRASFAERALNSIISPANADETPYRANTRHGRGKASKPEFSLDDFFAEQQSTPAPETATPTPEATPAPANNDYSLDDFEKENGKIGTPETLTKDTGTNVLGFIANSAAKGMTGNVDMQLNTLPNIANLGKAAAGTQVALIGDTLGIAPYKYEKYMPDVEQPDSDVSNAADWIAKHVGIDRNAPSINPTSPSGRVADYIIQSMAGAAMMPSQLVAGAGKIPRLIEAGKNALMGGVGGAAGGVTEEVTGSPLAGIGASLAVPMAANKLGGLANNLKEAMLLTDNDVNNAAVQKIMVNSGMTAEQMQEAIAKIKNKVDGSTATLGQGTANPSIEQLEMTQKQKPIQLEDGTSNVNAWIDHYDKNNAAQTEHLNKLIPEKQGAQKFTAGVNDHVNKLIGDKEAAATTAMDATGEYTAPSKIGHDVRKLIGGEKKAAEKAASAKWTEAGANDAPLFTIPLDELKAAVSKAYSEGFVPPEIQNILKLAEQHAMQPKLTAESPEIHADAPMNDRVAKHWTKQPINAESDNILTAIRKLGGINKGLFEQTYGNPKRITENGINNIFRIGEGQSISDMQSRLREHGYLTDDGDPHQLFSLLYDSPKGTLAEHYSTAKTNYDHLAPAETESDNIANRLRALEDRASAPKGKAPQELENTKVPISVIDDLRKLAGNNTINPNNPNSGRVAGILKDIISKATENADIGDPVIAAKLKDAITATRQKHVKYQEGATNNLWKYNTNKELTVEDAKVMEQFFNGSPRDVADYVRSTSGNAQAKAKELAERYIATKFQDANDPVKFRNSMKPILNVYHEVGARIDDALARRSELMLTQNEVKNSGMRHFIVGKDPEEGIASFMKSSTKIKDIADIEKAIDANPALKTSLAGAVKDHFLSKITNPEDSLHNATFSKRNMIEQLGDRTNRRLFVKLLGRSGLREIDKLLFDLKQQRPHTIAGSTTSINQANGLNSHFKEVLTRADRTGILKALHIGRLEDVQAAISKGMLNPEAFAEMLKNSGQAEREAVASNTSKVQRQLLSPFLKKYGVSLIGATYPHINKLNSKQDK